MKHHKSLARLTAIMLAITLTAAIPAPSLTAYADTGTAVSDLAKPSEKQAQKAAAEVLSRITVPDSYKSFTWDGIIQNGTAYYEFKWSDKNHTITVDYYDGFIYSYNHSNFYTDYPTFAKMSLAEQEKCAREHIYRLNPDIKGDIILTREDLDYSLDSTVQYSISRHEQGINVTGNEGYVMINRETGELRSLKLDRWLCADGADFPDASKRLTEEEICSLFAGSGVVPSPEYRIYYDTEYLSGIKTLHPYALPIYEIKNSGNELDAFTGKRTSYYSDRNRLGYIYPYSWRGYWVETCGGDYEPYDPDHISREEEEAYDRQTADKPILTEEKAQEIVKGDEFIALDSRLTLTDSRTGYYRDDNMNVSRTLTLLYDFAPRDDNKHDLGVTLDGYTGEILSFHKDHEDETKEPVKETAAVSAARKAASHFMGKRASEYRYDGNLTSNEKDAAERDETGYSRVKLTRYINGIPAPFDTVEAVISPRGEVMNFYYDYHNIDIAPGKALAKEEACKRLFEAFPPELYFRGFTSPDGRTHVYLNYEFDSEYYINALTGERYTEYGRLYSTGTDKGSEAPEAYNDIKGHKYEKEIAALRQYGVYLPDSGDTFRPDDPITVEEFTSLCLQTQLADGLANELHSGDIYPRIETTDPQTGETIYKDDPRVNSPLTYGDLARIFVIHYRDSGHNPDPNANYRQPYKNVIRDDPNYGYIAIAKRKGYISGGSEFDSGRVITRGECMKYAYDYIENCHGYKPLYEIIKI